MRNNNNNNTCNDNINNNHSSSNNKKYLWCRFSYYSPSTTLLLLVIVIPLLVFFGFVSVLGPTSSNWVFTSNYSSTTYLNSNTNNNIGGDDDINKVNNNNGIMMGLRSNMVVDIKSNIEKEDIVSDDSQLNSSSSPPLSIEALSQASHDEEEEEQLNVAQEIRLDDLVNVSDEIDVLSPNETDKNVVPSIQPRRKKEFTHLDRLEGRLMKARSAISEANKFGNETHDPEYIPVGPMYWNSKAFHRSYLEMEKEFKVFVYEEGEPPLFHNGPCKSIYSMEGNFIHEIEINRQFRTKDPHKAHVFFLPFSVTMLVHYVYVRDSHDFHPIKHTVMDYLKVISERYPFWNRSLAADHFMLSCHDWGPETSKSDRNLYRNSIRVLCNANTSEGFNPTKDVSFPEINLLSGTMDKLLGGPSASRRPILAFFAGGVHGPIRPVLLEHWENKGDPDMKIQKYLPKGVSYYDMLRKSKYCVCPSGYEVASPRVVEAIYTGCVPVLISNHYVPPFSDVLNWKKFSVVVSVKDIPNLKDILAKIRPRQYIKMQRRVLKIRRHFEVNSPPKRFDVFHMILHSIWLRRLNIKLPEDQ